MSSTWVYIERATTTCQTNDSASFEYIKSDDGLRGVVEGKVGWIKTADIEEPEIR